VMHPNPTSGNFQVNVRLSEEAPVTLSVWSLLTGRLVQQAAFEQHSSHQAHFDIRPLTPGLYVLRLDHEQGKEYIRFVVH